MMEDIYSDCEVYHPLAVVGKGTFGKVLQCWRASDGEMVALKALTTAAQWRGLVANELRLTATLDQSDVDRSHIVRFFESFQHQTQRYLVFELLEKSLYELQLENGFRPLPVRHIRTISCQMLRALAKLKEMAIVHTDIKPENIMLVDQRCFPFRVKLIDFGSASFFQEVRYAREPYIQSRFYRSPEVLLGLPFCEKVDMWSLGCVLAELYLGYPLFPGDSEFEQVRYICETQGVPSPHLLSMAPKTTLFFRPTETPHGNLVWQLLPTGQGTGPDGGRVEGIPERRKYVLSSLDQLYDVHGPDREFEREDAAAEAADRHCMVEFIKRTLTLNCHCRINASAALRHPFLTLVHLHGPKTLYYNLSLQELRRALISLGPSRDRLQTPPPPYRGREDFPLEPSNQEEPLHQRLEVHHHGKQKAHAHEPKHHETCSEMPDLQAAETHRLTLDQVENLTEKLEELSNADTEGAPLGWFGDVPPYKCPQTSKLTSLKCTLQPIKQPNARPSRSHPTNVPFPPLQIHNGSSPTTASSGISQPRSPECDDPPQFFTAKMPPSHKERSAQGLNVHPSFCTQNDLEDVPCEADSSFSQEPALEDLNFQTSSCSSFSPEHQPCWGGCILTEGQTETFNAPAEDTSTHPSNRSH